MKTSLRSLSGALLLLVVSASAAAAHVEGEAHAEPFDPTLLALAAGVLLVAAAVTLALLPRRPRR